MPARLLSATLLAAGAAAAASLTVGPAEARGLRRHHPDVRVQAHRLRARRAPRDRTAAWPEWEERRPFESYLPPATRERVAAPPFTGWGYGGTVPGAWPGF